MYSKELSTDIKGIITFCYNADPKIVSSGRTSGESLQDKIDLEVDCLLNTDESFKFYKIMNKETMVGYFGTETTPINCLTTFFIMPEYRKDKKDIWSFILSSLNKPFYAGLFKANNRAIKFFENIGATMIQEVIAENEPVFIFEFRG